jgi:predicted RNase H-like HicB family nuclease
MKKANMTYKFAVVFEKSPTGYSAYLPDVPGCVAASSTLAETSRLIREAVQIHLKGMREDGDPVPEATTLVEMVDVTAPSAA